MKRRSFFGSFIALLLPAAAKSAPSLSWTGVSCGFGAQVLHEAGHPILVAREVEDADDIAIYASGITWIDSAYTDRIDVQKSLSDALSGLDIPRGWRRS